MASDDSLDGKSPPKPTPWIPNRGGGLLLRGRAAAGMLVVVLVVVAAIFLAHSFSKLRLLFRDLLARLMDVNARRLKVGSCFFERAVLRCASKLGCLEYPILVRGHEKG